MRVTGREKDWIRDGMRRVAGGGGPHLDSTPYLEQGADMAALSAGIACSNNRCHGISASRFRQQQGAGPVVI